MDGKEAVMVTLSLVGIAITLFSIWRIYKDRDLGYINALFVMFLLIYSLGETFNSFFWFIPAEWGFIDAEYGEWHAEREWWARFLAVPLAALLVFKTGEGVQSKEKICEQSNRISFLEKALREAELEINTLRGDSE